MTHNHLSSEEALNELESYKQQTLYLRSILESPQGIIIFSLDTHYRYTLFARVHAQTMREIWGASIDIGTCILDVINNDTDRQRAQNNFDNALSGKYLIKEEEYGDECLKRTFWENSYSPTYDDEGKIIGVTVFVTDISVRKRMEMELIQSKDAAEAANKMLHAVLDTVPVRIFWKDAELRYLGCNRAFAADADVGCPEDLIGKDDFQMVWKEQAEIFRDGDRRVMASGIPQLSYEEQQTTANRGKMWLRTSKVPLRNEADTVIGILGVYDDITESKKIKEQLLQSQKMESIGQLAGGLAHDFNNLLSIINGYCGLLQMKMMSEEQLSVYVAKIVSASERAGELTHCMMAFSRTQVMKLEHHNLNVIVSKVGDFVKRIIGENITFKVDIKDASLFVYVDGGQIEQVLINLANNARDAMPKGGTFTFLTDFLQMNDTFPCVNGVGPPGRYAVITAADTGTGMDEATRKKIFEPFFTTKEVGQGTGLGLAMVIGIVSQHNGYVTVSSEQGHGTGFTIYLPLSLPGIKASAENMDTALEKYSGTETILVVEDDADIREFMQQFLAMHDYTVLTATDGEDALRTFKADADGIGLVITDLIMPRMNGKQMFDEIRRIRPDMKALFSSGYSAKIIEQQGDLGANAEFMTKPLQPALLVKMVREMLDRPLK